MNKEEIELKNLKEEFIVYQENVKYRDYLIKTNFLGKLTNKEMIESFKRNVFFRYYSHNVTADMTNRTSIPINFNYATQDIKMFDFNVIDSFKRNLNDSEKEQEVLDKEKKIKKEENSPQDEMIELMKKMLLKIERLEDSLSDSNDW